MSTDHPFQPGTEVCLIIDGARYRPDQYLRRKVAKVHKTGRFTLEGDDTNAQYRPCPPSEHGHTKWWHASRSTPGTFRREVILIEPCHEERIAKGIRDYRAYQRFWKIRALFDKLDDKKVTDEQLDLFEKALGITDSATE